ncbi:hypothetical protein ElyMa_006710900 [Elysia marginata]|uniref:Uncharacterized protein n=1 Tax=Elysia marginata TaxID=1093978 RepID=A0AAV4IS77_9GAST|nr:hypothetical protein ElyMa_006710900 [Elysia marginata]
MEISKSRKLYQLQKTNKNSWKCNHPLLRETYRVKLPPLVQKPKHHSLLRIHSRGPTVNPPFDPFSLMYFYRTTKRDTRTFHLKVKFGQAQGPETTNSCESFHRYFEIPVQQTPNALQEVPTPQTSGARPFNISPVDIRAFPKAPPRKELSKGRKRGKSMVATSTPEMLRILRETERKKAKRVEQLHLQENCFWTTVQPLI